MVQTVLRTKPWGSYIATAEKICQGGSTTAVCQRWFHDTPRLCGLPQRQPPVHRLFACVLVSLFLSVSCSCEHGSCWLLHMHQTLVPPYCCTAHPVPELDRSVTSIGDALLAEESDERDCRNSREVQKRQGRGIRPRNMTVAIDQACNPPSRS